MNFYLSIFYRVIPLIMALVCFCLGAVVYYDGTETGKYLAGPVIFSLGAICMALFTTAATIIRQIINKYNKYYMFGLPIIAYLFSLITVAIGINTFMTTTNPIYYVAGHVIFGVGMIAICVSTVATSSTKFYMIPKNSKTGNHETPEGAFEKGASKILLSIPIICAAILWIECFYLLQDYKDSAHFIAGNVSGGLAAVCTSLIGLVASILRQIRNIYIQKDKWLWPGVVLSMGTLCILWGILILVFNPSSYAVAPGFVLIGLGLVCFSISSKIILLAMVWKHDSPLAEKITLIPIITALICLFLSSFLIAAFGESPTTYIPARILVGLGAICFSLFSIVSILESGTSQK